MQISKGLCMAIFSSNFLRLIFQIILLFSHPNFYNKSNKHKTLINRPRTHTRRDQFFKELQCRDFRLKVISSHMKAEIFLLGKHKRQKRARNGSFMCLVSFKLGSGCPYNLATIFHRPLLLQCKIKKPTQRIMSSMVFHSPQS